MKAIDRTLAQAIADCLDRRRLTLTNTKRVVLSLKDNVLQKHSCCMAIPMIYAIWEGFAKEVLQLYLEYIKESKIPQSKAATALLAYAWSRSFKKLSNNLDQAKKVELVDKFFAALNDTLVFETSEVETNSNLKFAVLQGIATELCLDLTALNEHQKKLDALVNRRNNIAHGGREPDVSETLVSDYGDSVLALMLALEETLLAAIKTQVFFRLEHREVDENPNAGFCLV